MQFTAPFGALTVAHADLQQSALSLQYALPSTWVQPYLGAGVSLTRFSGEQFTLGVQGPQELQLKDSVGVAAQAGLQIPLGRHGLLNAEARFAQSSPTAFVDGTRLQTLEVDPWSLGLYAGWRF
jgi:outer membrane protein